MVVLSFPEDYRIVHPIFGTLLANNGEYTQEKDERRRALTIYQVPLVYISECFGRKRGELYQGHGAHGSTAGASYVRRLGLQLAVAVREAHAVFGLHEFVAAT